MKRLLYTLLFVLLFHITSRGQAIELTPSYGYQLGTKLNYGPNFLRFDDGDQLSIVLGVETANELMAELTYIRQNAELTIRDVVLSPQETYLADLSADWFQLGGTQYFGNENMVSLLNDLVTISKFSSVGLKTTSPKPPPKKGFKLSFPKY